MLSKYKSRLGRYLITNLANINNYYIDGVSVDCLEYIVIIIVANASFIELGIKFNILRVCFVLLPVIIILSTNSIITIINTYLFYQGGQVQMIEELAWANPTEEELKCIDNLDPNIYEKVKSFINKAMPSVYTNLSHNFFIPFSNHEIIHEEYIYTVEKSLVDLDSIANEALTGIQNLKEELIPFGITAVFNTNNKDGTDNPISIVSTTSDVILLTLSIDYQDESGYPIIALTVRYSGKTYKPLYTKDELHKIYHLATRKSHVLNYVEDANTLCHLLFNCDNPTRVEFHCSSVANKETYTKLEAYLRTLGYKVSDIEFKNNITGDTILYYAMGDSTYAIQNIIDITDLMSYM